MTTPDRAVTRPDWCRVELYGGAGYDGTVLDVTVDVIWSGRLVTPRRRTPPRPDCSINTDAPVEQPLPLTVWYWDGTVNEDGHHRFRRTP